MHHLFVIWVLEKTEITNKARSHIKMMMHVVAEIVENLLELFSFLNI